MPEFLDLEITTDAPTLVEDGVEAIRSLAGDESWTPSPLEEWMLAAVARMAVEVAILTGQVPLAIFMYFGQAVLGVPVLDATPASGTITVTASDSLGHTIPAGAQIGVDGVDFTTLTDIVIPAAATTATGTIVAVDPGTAANGLAGSVVELIAPTYTYVSGVTLTGGATSGGTDGETGEEYADRLADELPTLSPKAILIEDFEALARRHALVTRALAIDNYDPGPPIDAAAEGHVTVAVQDSAGESVGTTARNAVAADLASGRVLNLAVHVIDPTYTTINVSFTVNVHAGWDATSVSSEAVAAVASFLSPATWGRPALGDAVAWVDEPTVRRNDLFGVLFGVAGVRHVTALTLAKTGDVLATSDVTLTGPAGLPRAGTITPTVA